MSYVERNPLRAGIVDDAGAYEWSSARAHLGGAIRTATYTGRPFGSDEFVSALEQRLNRRLRARAPGRPKKATQVPAAG